MRQLLVQVPEGRGKEVLAMAQHCNGTNLACLRATGTETPLDLVYIHVANGKVEGLLEALGHIPEMRVTLTPHGVIPLYPPHEEVAEQVRDVENRSPIEIFLAGLQSVGSWRGFLGYTLAAGIVVWIALFTNSVFLQIAAMLVAPFAGPAMNAAVASARGDGALLGHSLVRYFSAIGVTIAVTALLHYVLGDSTATNDMVSVSKVSSVAALLPLIAGAAGALTLVQSERSSLVPGAATGVLVAAALAPPAGVIGMSAVIGKWDMALNGLFLLLLQLVGINLSGSIVFRIYGLAAKDSWYARGRPRIFPITLGVTITAFAALLTWQFYNSPLLQRSSVEQRAAAQVQKVVDGSGLVDLVETNVRFTRPNIPDQETLLVIVYVQRKSDVALPPEHIQRQLEATIVERLQADFDVAPLVDVTVFEPPTTSNR